MGKAKHVGKNLDTPPAAPSATTDIEPVAPPTIVNATLSADDAVTDPVEPKSSYHKNEMLESIYDKRNRQLDELIAAPEPDSAPEEAVEGDAEQAPSATTEEVSPSASEPEVPAQEPQAASPQKYPVIVNGQRIEYTLEELQQQAQLGVAARQKFEEAAEMRRQAEHIASSRQNSQPQPAVNNNTNQQLSDIPKEELLDIAKRMNYGTEEEQVEALRKAATLFGSQQGRNQPTPEQMIQVATQNALATLTAQQEQAILKSEFPDIASDAPIAYATDLIATQLAQKYAALGQQKSRLDLLREAGNEARNRYLKPAASTPPVSQPISAAAVKQDPNKVERKRAAPQTPTAASAVARSSSDGNNSTNPEQVAQAMRKNAMTEILKARGQPVI